MRWLLILYLNHMKHKIFNEQEYEKELKIINIEKASTMGLMIMIPVFLLFGGVYILVNGNPLPEIFSSSLDIIKFLLGSFILLVVFIAGAGLHELIHGITWSIFLENGFKSIKFGVLWKTLTPYCHSKEPMKIKHYMLGAIMPALLLGFVPAIWGIVVGSFWTTIFGILFTIAAIGDFMIIQLLIKENMNDYAEDHPSEAGCFVYRKRINE